MYQAPRLHSDMKRNLYSMVFIDIFLDNGIRCPLAKERDRVFMLCTFAVQYQFIICTS